MIDLVIDFDSLDDKSKLFATLKGLKGKQNIKIQKHRNKRSDKQNKYYWGVVIAYISNETGFTDEEVHELLKFKFLQTSKVSRQGSMETFIQSTTELDTLEAEEYLYKIRIWALNFLNLQIPLPNEVVL